jgi:hypothetical protein
MEGIEFWTSSAQQFSPTVHQYPAHLGDQIEAALESQGRIGWHEATYGLLSKQWSVLSYLDMHNPNRTDVAAGTKRMTSIHAHASRLWTARNEVLHSKQDDAQANIRSSEVAEIRALHQQPHLLRGAGDRHYCERSLKRILQGTSSMRRRWLRRVRQSIAEHQSDGGRQSLVPHHKLLCIHDRIMAVILIPRTTHFYIYSFNSPRVICRGGVRILSLTAQMRR